jgi:signal peptidase II
MRMGMRIAVLVFVLFATIGCDQSTKAVARAYLEPGQPVRLLGGVVMLAVVENPGAMLGLGEFLPDAVRFVLFVFAIGVVLVVALGYLAFSRHLSRHVVVAGALTVAGGFGNLVDRIVQSGCVTDFVILGIGRYRTGVFNVADLAILSGIVIVVAHVVKSRPSKGFGA